MEFGPIRPRFEVRLRGRAADSVARLRARIDAADCPVAGRVVANHVDVSPPSTERHLWSPWMQMEFLDLPDGARDGPDGAGAVVRVLIGPQPNLWTMFAFGYLSLAIGAVFAGVFGLVQLWLREHPWGLWVTAPCILGMVALYLGSQYGQRAAAPQTKALRAFARETLSDLLVPSDPAAGAHERDDRPAPDAPAITPGATVDPRTRAPSSG